MIDRDFLDLMRKTLTEIERLTEPVDEGVYDLIDEALEEINEQEIKVVFSK